MRILMLAHRIPYPPHTGDKVRAYRVARYLAERHDLTLGFVVDDPADREGPPVLAREIGDLEYAFTWKPWASIKSLAALATPPPLPALPAPAPAPPLHGTPGYVEARTLLVGAGIAYGDGGPAQDADEAVGTICVHEVHPIRVIAQVIGINLTKSIRVKTFVQFACRFFNIFFLS